MVNKKTILRLVFLLIILFSGYQLFWNVKGDLDFQKGQEEIQAVKEDLNIEHASSRQAEIEKFNRLKAEVPHLVAWLSIPGAGIDFPVVQGSDNDYYLNHDYRGNYNPYGAPFLDKDNHSNFNDQNSIIYGHNVRDKKVFGELTNYLDPTYLKKAPVIELLTEHGKEHYAIKCVYVVDPYANFRSPHYEGQEWQTFTGRWEDQNILNLPAPKPEDQLLTLQTCAERDERLVIHGVKIK